MEAKIYKFEESAISFTMDKNNNVMVNATEMAKVYDKQVNEFLSNKATQEFISECLKNGNSRFISVENEEDLVISRQKSGTWMHRILALKFAAWLNPRFELWVYSTIEKLLFGKHVEREKSFERTLRFQQEIEYIRNKAPEDRTGKDFSRYLDLERILNKEKALRRSLTTDSIGEMKTLFEEPKGGNE